LAAAGNPPEDQQNTLYVNPPETGTRLGFFPKGCTTAMGILPHQDPARALELAFSLDIPFWPQLPNISFSEDTYVQTIKGFPGIYPDYQQQKLYFVEEDFLAELPGYLETPEDAPLFTVDEETSLTLEQFKEIAIMRSEQLIAIRGQLMGPISMCLKVIDQEKKPIIYRDEVRELVILHIARKVNNHWRELKEIHPHAFVWVDEPGLEILFAGITGYSAERARADLELFLSQLESVRGVHLCGNPDWDFLLQSEIDLLSFNAYGTAEIIEGYASGIAGMLERGGVISWGIVPTNFEQFRESNAEALAALLTDIWSRLESKGVDHSRLFLQSMVAPATCCLVNPDLTLTVEKAFEVVKTVSAFLKA
jgi:hypothetical protein